MRYGVLFIFSLVSCSGGSHGSTATHYDNPVVVHDAAVPDADDSGVVTVAHCPVTRPTKTGKFEISELSFCEKIADAVALCEAPQGPYNCEKLLWQARRADELEKECMSKEIDPEKLTFWVDTVGLCSYGEDYRHGTLQNFPCDFRISCFRAAGIRWEPTKDPTLQAN